VGVRPPSRHQPKAFPMNSGVALVHRIGCSWLVRNAFTVPGMCPCSFLRAWVDCELLSATPDHQGSPDHLTGDLRHSIRVRVAGVILCWLSLKWRSDVLR